jgi:hypothetical protein
MSEILPNDADSERDSDESFSDYDEQEQFIARLEDKHSLSNLLSQDAESNFWQLDEEEEIPYVVPPASVFGLLINWEHHPNGTHVYGYRMQGYGGFEPSQKTGAGNGVYLTMRPNMFAEDETETSPIRHAFIAPKSPMMVVNEPAYLETHPSLALMPIQTDDTIWLKLCKTAAQSCCTHKNWKWDDSEIGDTLTRLLWSAGYDSLYFFSPGSQWVVLLMPGRPEVALGVSRQTSAQKLPKELGHAQPILIEAVASFEDTRSRKVPVPMTINDWNVFGEWEYLDMNGDMDIRFSEVRLQCFFSQDRIDNSNIPFCEIIFEPTDPGSEEDDVSSTSHLVCIKTAYYCSHKEFMTDLDVLPDIKLTESILSVGEVDVNPDDFKNPECLASGECWYWNGSELDEHPSILFNLFNPPGYLSSGEWLKLIHDTDYIRRHTTHPRASTITNKESMFWLNRDDFIELVLMLPEQHLQNLGLLHETLEWIRRERQLCRLPLT